MRPIRISLILFFLLNCFYGWSQTAEVRGFIYHKKSGEPIIFTNVFLAGTKFGAMTDVNGFYSINQIPPGSYTLKATGLGYDTASVSLTLKGGEKLSKNLFLQEQTINLQTIDVSGDKSEMRTEVRTSVIKITPKQISQLPSIGGEPDLAQYLQVLPGVVFTGDQGGQLYIRGGSPIQNKVLLDGMVIYNPFHSIGLFSVFETDIIRNVNVHAGGFSAEYGGRISAVMDITTRDGNKKRFGGKVAASPFTSKLLLEGPIGKYKEDGNSISYILTGRTSYLEQSSKLLYSYIDTAGLPYNFTDFYGKLSVNSPSGSKVNFFGFRFNDKVNYISPAALEWNSSGFGTNFVLVPASSSVLVSGNFAYSGYAIGMQEETRKPRSSEINGFNSGLDFTYFRGSNELKYGFEVMGFKTDFVYTNSANAKVQQESFTTELAGYLKYKWAFNKLLIEPSMRLHYYASQSELSPEPRFGIKYLATENIRFKAAGGYFSQNFLSATSDRDVVNLFYGFLSGPTNLQKKFEGEDVTSSLQKARHLVAGIEIDFLKHFEINAETYVKYFNQLTNINRDKIFPDNTDPSIPDYQKKDFIIERGKAIGADLLVKYDYKRTYIWIAYSLGLVDRFDGIRTYNPHFDRRHNINLVSAYKFGKDMSWEIDARWNFGTGFPFTPTQGFYEKIAFDEGINSNYTNSNGDLGIIYGELNSYRLPYYHRMDIAAKKRIVISDYSTLEITAGATNIYNRKNIFYYDRILNQRKDQLPILPSIGINLTF